MPELVFRAAVPSDAEGLIWLAERSPEAPHWTPATWKQLLSTADSSRRLVLVGEYDAEPVGFGVIGTAASEAEIESIAVSSSWRRRGIATQICERLIEWARTRGAAQILLEVRASNSAARALYRSLNFEEQGVRPRYYREPVEDAVLMSRSLQI